MCKNKYFLLIILVLTFSDQSEQYPQRQGSSIDDRYYDDRGDSRGSNGDWGMFPNGGRNTNWRPDWNGNNNNNGGWTFNPNVNPATSTTSRPTTTSSITECLRNCPTTPEYNPVCGSDGVTYSNPGRLQCAINCGRSIVQWRYGACDQNVGATAPSAGASQ